MSGASSRVLRHFLCIGILASSSATASAEEPESLGQAWSVARQEARRLTAIAEIKAKLLDRKDIKARYVRVRFDGKKLELAGFVLSTNAAVEIEGIARKAAAPETVETHWVTASGLEDHDPYRTFVGEQASDFGIWLKVKAVLSAPDARAILSGAEVQTIDVNHGNVVVFLIVDTPPGQRDLEPHIRAIAGVNRGTVRTLQTFREPPSP